MPLYRNRCIAVLRLLEGDACILANRFKIVADDDDFRQAVGTQHVAEKGIAAPQRMSQDENAFRVGDGFRRAVPHGDILVRDDGFQPQRRQGSPANVRRRCQCPFPP